MRLARLATVLRALGLAAAAQERSTRVEATVHPGFARTRVVESVRLDLDPVEAIPPRSMRLRYR